MILPCRHGDGLVRDCTVLRAGRYAAGWYHVATGREQCTRPAWADGIALPATAAEPVPVYNVQCPRHWLRLGLGCHLCATTVAMQTAIHNDGRCAEQTCPFVYLHT